MIAKILASILFAITLALIIQRGHVRKDFHNRYMSGIQNACEFGCYYEAQNLCSRIKEDIPRGHCYDDALKKCPDAAVRFRRWVETGGRG